MSKTIPLRSLEGVPEELHEHAVEVDGGYDLTLPDGWALEDVGGLRKTADDWKLKAARLRKTADAFKDIDPEKARAALEQVAKLEASAEEDDDLGGGDGDAEDLATRIERRVKKAVSQVETQFKKQIEELQSERKTDREAFVERDKRTTAYQAVAGLTDDTDLMAEQLMKRMVRDESPNGDIVWRVRGDDGEPILAAKSGTDSVTDPTKILKHYVGTAMRDEFPRNFPGTKAQGGGMAGSSGSDVPSGQRTVSADDMESKSRSLEDIASGKVVVTD